MQQNLQPIVKDLVLIGGGHSHAIVLRMFGMKPLRKVRLTLITAAKKTAYSGMLPGHIAGSYSHDECHIDLQPLANFAQAQLYFDRVVALDLENNKVLCANGLVVDFDLLSIDIGSTPATGLYQVQQNMRSQLNQYRNYWNIGKSLIEAVGKNSQAPISIAIAGGVELALLMQSRLQ